MKKILVSLVACSFLSQVSAAQAETSSYVYDALGRLIATQNDRATTDRDVTTYSLDAAGNRSNVFAIRATAQITPIFRFERSDGQHFYTDYVLEGYGAGFDIERASFSLYRQSAAGMTALYRCYFPALSHHFMSAQSDCEGHTTVGLAGYVAGAPAPGLVALYRFYSASKSDHLITTDYQEGVTNGYVLEGTYGYVPSPPTNEDT